MNTRTTHSINASLASSGVLALLAYLFAGTLPGRPNPILTAAVAACFGFAVLTSGRTTVPSTGSRRASGRSMTLSTTITRGASRGRVGVASELRAEEDRNAELYGRIQSDLLTMTGHAEGSSDREFFFQRARENERNLLRSDTRIRTLRRRQRAA